MSDMAIVEIGCRFGGGTDSPQSAELIPATDPAAGFAAAPRAANGNSAAETATAPGDGENGSTGHGHTAYGTGSGGIPAPARVPANGAGDARPEGSTGHVLVAEEARP
ncbi:hypothetical protein [Nocardia rhamnosiphila]